MHEDEGRTRNRPGLLTGLVGEDQIKSLGILPIRVGGGRLKCLARRRDGPSLLVDHVGGPHVVLLRIGEFDIADRTLRLRNVVGDTFIALGADAGRPFDRSIGSDLVRPVLAGLRQVVREDESGPRAVRTVNDGNRLGGKIDIRVELLDGGIIP